MSSNSARLGVDTIFDNDDVQYLYYQRDPFRTGVRVKEPDTTFFHSLAYRYRDDSEIRVLGPPDLTMPCNIEY